MIHGDCLDPQSLELPEGVFQHVALIGAAAHLHEADVGAFETKQSRRRKASARQAFGDRSGLRFAEQERGERGGVDDLNGRRDPLG